MYGKMRSSFFCISCKAGYASVNDVKWNDLHGVPHSYQSCADKGFNAVCAYCPKCSAPVFTKLKHMIREQKFAYKRYNAKRRSKRAVKKT